jgi:alanyl-tRNA synthetase
VSGPLRIVEVGDFDFSACAGTHVAATGQIGLIKILRAEKNKGGVRVEFVCGARALADYAWKHDFVRRTAERYSTLDRELEASLLKLEEEAGSLRKQVRDLTDLELGRRACEIAGRAVDRGGVRMTIWSGDIPDADVVKGLGQKLKAVPNTVSLLAGTAPDGRAHLVFVRGEGNDLDLGPALLAALAVVGGKGGGRGDMVQGSGPDAERVLEALDAAAGFLSGDGPAGGRSSS